MILIILGILALLLTAFLCSTIRLSFQYDNRTQFFSLRYLIASLTIHPLRKKAILSLAGFPVKAFEQETFRASTTKKMKKKKIRLPTDWLGVWETLYRGELRVFKTVLGRIRIKYLSLKFSGGFLNPFQTGIAIGAFYALKGMFPNIMKYASFYPDYTSSGLRFEGKGLVYIRIYHILILALRLLIIKVSAYWREKSLTRKKGAAYAQ
ncbi:MAG: hypothetical protein HRF51_02630 [bacterium]|jgi:hypothetical protein